MTKKTNLEENMTDLMDLDEDEKSMVEIIDADKPLPSTVENSDDPNSEEDFRYARENIRSIIDNGVESITEMASVAQTSESPRAYEVLSNMMKTMIDANKDLLDLHKRKKELKTETQSGPERVQNNSIFVGTTAELQNLISKQNNET